MQHRGTGIQGIPDLLSNFRNMTWLSEQYVHLDETIHTINATLVAQLPGESI